MPPLGGPGRTAVGCPVMAALAESLLDVGSVSIWAVLDAVFVIVPVAVTVAVIVRVPAAPLAREPIAQMPVPLV